MWSKQPIRQQSQNTISPQELGKVLQAHALWLRTQGKEGKRADLSHMNLKGMDFSKADLRDANLCDADLRDAKFSDATLVHADVRGATFVDAKNLTGPQLGGANLSVAELGKDFDFNQSIQCINNQICDAGKTLLGISAICSFSLLTIASMTDITLITGAGSTTIPGQAAPITTVGFYYAVPMVLFLLYISFVLYLQRLWESIIKVPAILPEGVTICDRLSPWLPTGIIWKYFPQLRDRRPAMWWLQYGVSILLLWWIVPPTLHTFWARTLCIHDAVLTSVLALMVVSSVVTAVGTSYLAETTLREGIVHAPNFRQIRERVLSPRYAFVILAAIVLYPLASFMAFSKSNSLAWMPHRSPMKLENAFGPAWRQGSALQRMIYWPSADFNGKELSQKPDEFTDDKIDKVTGINLIGRDLRCIRASYAFLANADLRGANLDGAVLDNSDLRLAKLKRASLQCAKLANADLRGADLENAVLHGADLRNAHLEGANLKNADFYGADLRGAMFRDEIMSDTTIITTVTKKLPIVWNPEEKDLTPKQLHSAIYDKNTRLKAKLIKQLEDEKALKEARSKRLKSIILSNSPK